MTSIQILSGSGAAAFGLAIEIALKGTFMLGLAGIAAVIARRAPASFRHLLWSAPLVAMLALPALEPLLPSWEVDVMPSTASKLVSPAADRGTAGATSTIGDGLIAVDRTIVGEVGGPRGVPLPQIAPPNRSLFETLALVWLFGVCVLLFRVAGGIVTLHRLARRASPLESDAWRNIVDDIAQRIGIRRNVTLLRSCASPMPATWGFVRPVILVPADADEWTEERRRIVLLHELSHVRRHDCLVQLVGQLCCALYWFNPLVWYAARRLRTERELACDEVVIGYGTNACDYAEHLLAIATTFQLPPRTSIAAVAMARPSMLEGRVRAILSRGASVPVLSRSARVAARVAVVAVVLPLAALKPWGDAVQAAASDTFRWSGKVNPGKWIEVYTIHGEIRAELSTGSEVEIVAVRKSGAAAGWRIASDRPNGGVRFCAVTSAAYESRDACAIEMHGSLQNGARDTRVDFVVKIPAGVGIAAHTERGNIIAEGLRSYVWGTAGVGNIRISTSDLAEASTRTGSIVALFGVRRWAQDLEFLADSGNVTVTAPADGRMMIDAESLNGGVASEFGVSQRSGRGERSRTPVSKGRGMLTLRTSAGMVTLKRGNPALADISNMIASRANAPSSADPKPNPNPNPDFDPDPNLNPHVDASTDEVAIGADPQDPTGERISLTIPNDLLSRHTDAMMARAPDRVAIVRFRDIAASHVKQHAADLVRERAEWALTLVRDGEIVMPLRAELSSGDWRVRAYAAWALGETRDPRATAALTASLGDAHWRVRMHAATGLQRLGGSGAVQPLIGVLTDSHWQVRISAVDALAAIGDRRAIPSLRAVVERDPRSIVKDEARNAIQRIESKS